MNNQVITNSFNIDTKPSQIKNKNKQLPLKSYFLNKYEQFKHPSVLTSNLNQLQNTLNPFSSNLFIPTHLSNNLTTIENNLSLYNQTLEQQNNQITVSSSKAPIQNQIIMTSGGASKRHFSGSNSSLQNSDDDDDYEDFNNGGQNNLNKSREEKRRLSHTAAEQKRRNAIKRGYDELQQICPNCDYMDPSSSQKVCKATVLKRWFELLQNCVPSCQQNDPIISMRITRATTLEQTIDYIHELEKEKDKHEQDLDSLKKEIMALKIMKSNYEEILHYHRNMPKDNNVEINDEAKFDLFVKFSDNLFQSFQSMINPNSFADLSSSMFNWLEQMCSSNNLKNLVLLSLFQVAQQMLQ